MIQIEILTGTLPCGGNKERATNKDIGEKPIGVKVIFSGKHYLPVQEIPIRISRMKSDDFMEIPPGPRIANIEDISNCSPGKIFKLYITEDDTSGYTQFISHIYPNYQVFAKEIEINGEKTTVAVWPLGAELNIDELGNHLLSFSHTTSEPLKKIPGWKKVRSAQRENIRSKH